MVAGGIHDLSCLRFSASVRIRDPSGDVQRRAQAKVETVAIKPG